MRLAQPRSRPAPSTVGLALAFAAPVVVAAGCAVDPERQRFLAQTSHVVESEAAHDLDAPADAVASVPAD